MLKKEGFDGMDRQHWKLLVPDEHCAPGLEVGVVACETGLQIGGEIISWGDLEKAKRKAQKSVPF